MREPGRTRHAAVTEYEYEPVPGLPERLPPGEEILWQGAPRWESLARQAFHVRKVGIYFLILIAWTVVWDIRNGRDPVVSAFWLVVAAALAMSLLTLLARVMARSTLYTITNHRVVMRFGVAIPMTINLPFGKITRVALRDQGDGVGDIPLTLGPEAKTSYLVLWPHARPWCFSPPEPMLRAIPEAKRVARILATALGDDAGVSTPRVELAQDTTTEGAFPVQGPADGNRGKGAALAAHRADARPRLAYPSDPA